ncbi:MAG: hypothetical protein ACRD3H_04420 [Terriglobales bacterium]
MAMTGYTKLFNSILASTIWREDDKTRLVWITLLAMTDQNGAVEASLPGLADLARVSIDDCERALENLQKPDKYSRSKEHDGRRIETIDGGWLVLNRAKYRDKMSEDDRRERDRDRQRRHRQSQTVTSSVTLMCDRSHMSRQAEAETEAETKTTNTTAVSQQESLPDNSSSHTTRKKARRKRTAILSAYPQTVSDVVNRILPIWPAQQPNGEKIRPDVAAFAGRIDEILRDNENANPELLITAAEKYLSEQKRFYRAPQFFFGPSNGTEAPWVAYARMIVHQRSKSQAAEVASEQ